MGEIEHVGGWTQRPRRGPAVRLGRLGQRGRPAGFAGRPIVYEDDGYSAARSWELLPEDFRAWAESRAGAAIRDPHTGVETVYWTCRVRADAAGPRGAARTATYDLVMFGKRGLVVSSGTTEQFVDRPGATRWRHRRFDVPVDASGVRNDHRRRAPPNTAPPGTPPDRAAIGPPAGSAAGHVAPGSDLLPSEVAGSFGNLPLPTQEFLLEPFLASGSRPAEAGVDATTVDTRHEHTERLWVHLFNARWVGFAHARRSVLRGRRAGRAASAYAAPGLQSAPWSVAAWIAPVRRDGHGPGHS